MYGTAVKCMFIIDLYKYAYRVIHILFFRIGSDKQVDSGWGMQLVPFWGKKSHLMAHSWRCSLSLLSESDRLVCGSPTQVVFLIPVTYQDIVHSEKLMSSKSSTKLVPTIRCGMPTWTVRRRNICLDWNVSHCTLVEYVTWNLLHRTQVEVTKGPLIPEITSRSSAVEPNSMCFEIRANNKIQKAPHRNPNDRWGPLPEPSSRWCTGDSSAPWWTRQVASDRGGNDLACGPRSVIGVSSALCRSAKASKYYPFTSVLRIGQWDKAKCSG